MAEVVLPSAARGAGRRAERTVGGLLSMPLSPDRRSHLLRRECRDRQRKSCGVGAVQKRCLPRLPAALPPASCLHLIRFMHSALALWLSHDAFSSLHWTADRGQLASVETARLVWWNLPLQPGIGHHPFAGLFGGAVGRRSRFDGLSPDPSPTCWKGYEAGRMDQGSWPVGQLAQGGSSHAERDQPFRHDPSLPKECPILDNHKPQLQVRSSWPGCLASSIGAPMPPSTTKRPAGPWIRDSSLRQQRKAVDAGPSNLVNL